MFAVLPVILLIISVVLIWIFALVKLRPGSIWLFSAFAVTIAWGMMIPVGLRIPNPIIINNWLPEPHSFTGLVFQYTSDAWVLGFLLCSLLTAVIFAEAKHLETPAYVRKISSSILLTAIALLAVMSKSLLAFVISWALIDLIEFGVLAVLFGQSRTLVSATSSILFRAVGLFLLILLVAITPSNQLSAKAIDINPVAWGLILVLTLFRMGTLPLFQPYVQSPDYQRGVVTILRVVPLATTYAFIPFVSDTLGLTATSQFWLVIVSIGTLWGGISWFTATSELHGRPYFLFTMAGLGLTALMTGSIDALPGLSVLLITGGAGIFLYKPRLRKVNPFIILLIIGLLSFPFSPSASISYFFTGEISLLNKVLCGIGLAITLAGLVKHSLKRVEEIQAPEPWMRLFHTVALYFLAITPWIIVGLRWKEQLLNISWWSGIILIFLASMTLAIFVMLRSRLRSVRVEHKRVDAAAGVVGEGVGSFFRFTWLSRVFSLIGVVIAQIVSVIARVIEGDGGILWSFLFIVLLLSLLIAGQAP